MFWKYNLVENSKIDELIDSSEDVTLEVLMNEEDILQECKGQSKKLIEFLTKPEVMEQMVQLITHEPPDTIEETVRYKYPNLACELLTSDVNEITDCLVNNNSYLDNLYSFLQQKTDTAEISSNSENNQSDNKNSINQENIKPLNPLLASFFSKAFSILLSKQTKTFMDYLKTREDFITLLINHIGTSAIMDLCIRLVTCTEDNELRSQILNWLSEQETIQKLVSIIDATIDEDRHCNASQTLCDIIRTSREYLSQLQEKADPDPLLSSIESTEMVADLLTHMLNNERKEKVIVSGITVILALLDFKKPVFNMPINPQPLKEQNSSNEPPVPEHDPNALTALDIERMESGVVKTLAAVNTRLQDLYSLLKNPPQRNSMLSTAGTLNPPLGKTRLQIARLVVALIRANVHNINTELEKLGMVKVLLDLFFEYSYNNFLHTQVEQCIDVILANEPTKSDNSNSEPQYVLLAQLFEQIQIIQKILQAWEENEIEEAKPDGRRKGYMGHLTKIANHVLFNMENGSNSEVIGKYIKNLPEGYSKKWEDFVNGSLSQTNERNKIVPVTIVQQPPSSADDNSSNYIEIAFPHDTALQQAFSDYQMQQMTSNFNDQFGFHEDEFSEHDGSTIVPISISQGVTFNISTNENTKNSDVFEQMCRQRLQAFDENVSSDEDIWDDKDQEVTFTSETQRKRTSSDNSQSTGGSDSDEERENSHSSGSTDSDEERDSLSERSLNAVGLGTPGTTQSSSGSDEIKMEVDGWTANFESVSMEESNVAMDIQDIWNTQSDVSTKQEESWANFSTFESDFSCQDPLSSSIESTKKSHSVMETADSPQTTDKSVEDVSGNNSSAISVEATANSNKTQPSDISNQNLTDVDKAENLSMQATVGSSKNEPA